LKKQREGKNKEKTNFVCVFLSNNDIPTPTKKADRQRTKSARERKRKKPQTSNRQKHRE